MTVVSARKLRKEMTPPERRLWAVLKARPEGFKFRRQHPIGAYTLDFFCHEAALAIEVDGLAHEMGSNPDRDRVRDALMSSEGVQTIRFRALDVRDNLDGIVTAIVDACQTRTAK